MQSGAGTDGNGTDAFPGKDGVNGTSGMEGAGDGSGTDGGNDGGGVPNNGSGAGGLQTGSGTGGNGTDVSNAGAIPTVVITGKKPTDDSNGPSVVPENSLLPPGGYSPNGWMGVIGSFFGAGQGQPHKITGVTSDRILHGRQNPVGYSTAKIDKKKVLLM